MMLNIEHQSIIDASGTLSSVVCHLSSDTRNLTPEYYS